MIALASYLVLAAAAALSIGIIVATVAPQWRRIAGLFSGRPHLSESRNRWRRLHLAAERRRPLTQEDR